MSEEEKRVRISLQESLPVVASPPPRLCTAAKVCNDREARARLLFVNVRAGASSSHPKPAGREAVLSQIMQFKYATFALRQS